MVTAGRFATASDINTACAALLAIEERGHLSRDLRTSTEAAGLSRVPGMGAVQRAPGARGDFARVHLEVAMILSLVRDVDHGGDKAPAAAHEHIDLPPNWRLSAPPR